jgi:hypothetical protein
MVNLTHVVKSLLNETIALLLYQTWEPELYESTFKKPPSQLGGAAQKSGDIHYRRRP